MRCFRTRACALLVSIVLTLSTGLARADEPIADVLSLLKKADVPTFSVLHGRKFKVLVIGEVHHAPKYEALKNELVKHVDRRREVALFLEGYPQDAKAARKLLEVSGETPLYGLDHRLSRIVGGVALLLPTANVDLDLGDPVVGDPEFEGTMATILEPLVFEPTLRPRLESAIQRVEGGRYAKLFESILETSRKVLEDQRGDFCHAVARTLRRVPRFPAPLVKELGAEILKHRKQFELDEETGRALERLVEKKSFIHDGITLEYRNRVFAEYVVAEAAKVQPQLVIIDVGEGHRNGLTELLIRGLGAERVHHPRGLFAAELRDRAQGMRAMAKVYERAEARLNVRGRKEVLLGDAETLLKRIAEIEKSEMIERKYQP